MKVCRIVPLILSLVSSSEAIKCGRPLTEPCLGETDIRYDPDASNSLVDQAEIFSKMPGFYSSDQVSLDSAGVIRESDSNGLFDLTSNSVFFNFTIEGSRVYRHTIYISPSVVQGGAGVALFLDSWGTSTFEKDGSYRVFSTQSSTDEGNGFSLGESSNGYPVANNTVYSHGFFSVNSQFTSDETTEALTCLDTECNTVAITISTYNRTARQTTQLGTMTRLTEDEFINAINTAYEIDRVPDSFRTAIPMEGECLTGRCPTEADFAMFDPNIATSPFQEPDGKVKPGAIAGFTIAGIVLLVVAGYLFHSWSLKQQAKRYRTKFAQRVAETIQVRQSARSLSPSNLADEFKRIDKENDRFISKEAMKDFLNSGKAGEISDSDFEALWAVLDADKSGAVDFLEFCAFMGKCHEDYNAARMDRGSLATRTSTRMIFAEKSARRVSEVQSMKAVAEDMAAGGDEEHGDSN